MTTVVTDVVVVGGGPVGENVADHVVRNGLDATIVENELVGGECSYWACMPSKALLGPARTAAAALRIPGGPDICGPFDPADVLSARDDFASHWRDNAQVTWLEENGINLVRGYGRLAGERHVEVTDSSGASTSLHAGTAVVLAVGSQGVVPPIDGLEEARPWGSREITSARAVPRRLGILGGGAVGCEMAQAWRRLGALEVILIERDQRLLPAEEPFVGEAVEKAFDDEGIAVMTDVEVDQVRRRGDELELRYDGRAATVDRLVVATGRRPALDDVGLEMVGVDPSRSSSTLGSG